jgi:hypothetical protein
MSGQSYEQARSIAQIMVVRQLAVRQVRVQISLQFRPLSQQVMKKLDLYKCCMKEKWMKRLYQATKPLSFFKHFLKLGPIKEVTEFHLYGIPCIPYTIRNWKIIRGIGISHRIGQNFTGITWNSVVLWRSERTCTHDRLTTTDFIF